jgi:ubiquinone/menaquinone biosynthesis C-methylase UbiE
MNFDKKAANYSENAVLQAEIAKTLVQTITHCTGKILDIGCGTGFVARYLREIHKVDSCNIWQVDKSHEMCKIAGLQSANTVLADMHSLPFEDASFEILTSSMCMQWGDVARVILEAKRVLKPHGTFYFAVPVEGSFANLSPEIQACMLKFPRVEIPGNIIEYPIYIDNLAQFFRSFNAIGTNSGMQVSAGLLRNLIKNFHPIQTSWKILYVRLNK